MIGLIPGIALIICALSSVVQAHSGPPFPIVTDRVAGPYRVDVWTDPDATNDGSAAGQFWVIVHRTGATAAVPEGTKVAVRIAADGAAAGEREQIADPVGGDPSRRFAYLVMDHEGRFAVRVTIDGGLGRAEVDTSVDATYDLRPAPALLFVYALPFLAVGLLWSKLLIRRRRAGVSRSS